MYFTNTFEGLCLPGFEDVLHLDTISCLSLALPTGLHAPLGRAWGFLVHDQIPPVGIGSV